MGGCFVGGCFVTVAWVETPWSAWIRPAGSTDIFKQAAWSNCCQAGMFVQDGVQWKLCEFARITMLHGCKSRTFHKQVPDRVGRWSRNHSPVTAQVVLRGGTQWKVQMLRQGWLRLWWCFPCYTEPLIEGSATTIRFAIEMPSTW